MGQILDRLNELKDDGMDYARLRWASMRLAAVDKISTTLSKAFGYLIFLILLFAALAFFMVALALWLGELLGHMSLGFLISGGAFLVACIITWFLGRRMVVNTIVRYMIDIFFPENDNGYGTQE